MIEKNKMTNKEIIKQKYLQGDPSLPAYDHKTRHVFLHDCLDELVADYISQNNKLMSETTVMELMEWSYQQTLNPTV